MEVIIISPIFRWETEAQRSGNLLRVTELAVQAVWPQSLCLAVNNTASLLQVLCQVLGEKTEPKNNGQAETSQEDEEVQGLRRRNGPVGLEGEVSGLTLQPSREFFFWWCSHQQILLQCSQFFVSPLRVPEILPPEICPLVTSEDLKALPGEGASHLSSH